jgi:hypothetical protein
MAKNLEKMLRQNDVSDGTMYEILGQDSGVEKALERLHKWYTSIFYGQTEHDIAAVVRNPMKNKVDGTLTLVRRYEADDGARLLCILKDGYNTMPVTIRADTFGERFVDFEKQLMWAGGLKVRLFGNYHCEPSFINQDLLDLTSTSGHFNVKRLEFEGCGNNAGDVVGRYLTKMYPMSGTVRALELK